MNLSLGPVIELPYDEAWLYCACLYYDGYSDWRWPLLAEVEACDDFDQHIPLWLFHDRPYDYRYNSTYNVVPVRTV